MEIRKLTANAFFSDPAWPALRAGYAAECGTKGLTPTESMPMYNAMEQAGLLLFFGAFINGKMVGFVTVLSNIMPHYDKRISIVESIYVAPEHRKSGAGLRLIRHAERVAREISSPGLFMSAPAGSRLEKVLPRLKFRHSNTVFFKEFA